MTNKNSNDPLVPRKRAATILETTPLTLRVDDCLRRRNRSPEKIGGRVYYRMSVLLKERQKRDEKKQLKIPFTP